MLTRGIGETVICICETRVTLKSRRGQRLKLGFLMNRQLVLVPRLNVVKRRMAEVVCISTRQSKAGPAPVLVIQAHTTQSRMQHVYPQLRIMKLSTFRYTVVGD